MSRILVSFYSHLPMKMEQSVPKGRHIKSRRRVITQKKAYNIKCISQLESVLTGRTGPVVRVKGKALVRIEQFMVPAANVSTLSRNVSTLKRICQLHKKCGLITKLPLLNLPHTLGQIRLPKRGISVTKYYL